MDSLSRLILPASLRDIICITEVDAAELLIAPLFQRKFGDSPPDVPHHLVALYRPEARDVALLGYSHMRPFGDIFLSGGSCTNGDSIRAMIPAHRDALAAAGGIWYWILKYAFAKFADSCDAFFGYSGDARALEVTRDAGFVDAGHPHLIVNWHKPLHENVRRALTAKAQALGPF